MTNAVTMSRMSLALSLLGAVALAAPFAEAEERRTLIGKWSTAEGRCQRPLSMIEIGPKSLAGEDFSCDFRSVSRRGDIVTWRGACTYGADAPVPETVTARLVGDRLHYRFHSQRGENGPFRRCP
jgi:hypothetical protein